MARLASVPRELAVLPFRGSTAVASGLITKDRLKSSVWQRLYPDVYVRAADFSADDHRMWCNAAALLLPPGGAVSGPSAAFLWDAGSVGNGAPVTVTVPAPHRLRSRDRLTVLHRRLPREDLASFGAVPVTAPVRTAFDLGRQPDRRKAIMALDALMYRKLVRRERLADLAADRFGWPGVAVFAARLAETEPLAESPMETVLRLLVTDAGLPRPVAQFDVRSAAGLWLARVDLAYPALRVAIEYEGDHHRDRATFRQDITRERRLQQAGWLVLRFTADDVFRTPADTVRTIAVAREQRLAAEPG
jgi:very-short-patch-repair endonuclease